MGTEPKGIIMYTPGGYMSAQLEHPGRPKFASGDWFKGTPEEIKVEASGYIAYSGPFHTTKKNSILMISSLISRALGFAMATDRCCRSAF